MEALQERPAYVRFEVRDIEDRDASIAAGHPCFKQVHFALITPGGSKDVIERVADEWFVALRKAVEAGRYNRKWYEAYLSTYEAWKRDEEPPLMGTPLREWVGLSQTHFRQLRDLRLLTVEDVAAMNEEALARIGMGARQLKQRAVDWLETARNQGVTAEKLSALTIENSQLRAQTAEQAKRLDALVAQVQLLTQGRQEKL